jgi:hypothetical protein
MSAFVSEEALSGGGGAYPKGSMCQAYRKDHRRCHKTSTENGLCAAHQDYYKDWFSSRPPLYGFMHYKRNRLYSSYKEQLATGHINITPADLNSLGDDNNYSDYYLLLCETCPHVNPCWNMYLLAKTLELDLMHWIRMPSYESHFMETFSTLSKAPGATLYAGFILVRFCMIKLMDYHTFHELDIRDRLEVICERIFGDDVWRTTLYSAHWPTLFENVDDLIKKHKKEEHFSEEEIALEINFYEITVKPILDAMRQTQQVCVQSRIAVYKEELMAAAWHPRRVESWVNHFGLGAVFDHI